MRSGSCVMYTSRPVQRYWFALDTAPSAASMTASAMRGCHCGTAAPWLGKASGLRLGSGLEAAVAPAAVAPSTAAVPAAAAA
eukprot:CAMPEP_0118853872 /NCGR_PEP_ID=MMETSP1163-20130328/2281_1 /TAXON_ID=124430 /ORGANISM="Phaeomonas parva, Strain CCMP2877" /LENGTH=81 /DNA_ID=CAMNT_0006786495 /DNA_START=888 /DNA_END=1129 /DNA_ORIENTATION=-